ncbi:MAG: glutamate racemase [Prevotella sp.]|nr:glutamate racemase [Prevotella sp.]
MPNTDYPAMPGPIGVFDSGYGGLTILEGIRQMLPEYDYVYLGDNARAPYGSRSFEVVYQFTRQALLRLFQMGCHLVVLGCNTASAKALRTLQQHDLPEVDPSRRVLGIIRPTAEAIGAITKSRHVGILATEGTVRSRSYELEIRKLFPDITVTGQACPLWAAIVEAGEGNTDGADYFVGKRIRQLLDRDPAIDSIILGCTHYPLLMQSIERHTPAGVHVVAQGEYVAASLKDYLSRHEEIASKITRGGTCQYFTTESPERFNESARIFLRETISARHVSLD